MPMPDALYVLVAPGTALAHVAAIMLGYGLDALIGDPYTMPHLIRLVGTLIAALERLLRRLLPTTKRGEIMGGVLLALLVPTVMCLGAGCALALAWRLSPVLGLVAETLVCYQMLAARQLEIEAERVLAALDEGGIEGARAQVRMIVGRDTGGLDEAGVLRATVETVAENASDGVVAPLVYMGLAGPVGGLLYKCVNTMDSMVGYRNERYRHFGRAAARLDDVLNWVPARLTGAIMCLVAPLVGLSGRDAWRIMRRDARRHVSPNAGFPEAACAGALGIALVGPASYFGEVHMKPWVGDATREIERADVGRATALMRGSGHVALVVACALRWAILTLS